MIFWLKKVNLSFFVIISVIIALLIPNCFVVSAENNEVNKAKTPCAIVRYPKPSDWPVKIMCDPPVYDPKSNDWIDLRCCDLTGLDLKNSMKALMECTFDTRTEWPNTLPLGFNPKKILEIGKNPGLGVKKLNKQGITGKGVGIAIIDQVPIIDHKEYKGKIKMYDEINIPPDRTSEMHGNAMLSLAVGNDIGVAPGANVYFIAASNADFHDDGSYDFNYISYSDAVNKILDLNKTLPKSNKIRVISISAGWTKSMKGYSELISAINRAKKEGVFVVSVNLFDTYGFYFHGLDRNYMADPEKVASFSPVRWDKWINDIKKNLELPKLYENAFDKSPEKEVLLVPMNSRTMAGFTGKNDYAIFRRTGWSAIMPYISGLYALSCQVKPDINPELFWKQALATGDRKEIVKGKSKHTGKIINPAKLIDSLKKLK